MWQARKLSIVLLILVVIALLGVFGYGRVRGEAQSASPPPAGLLADVSAYLATEREAAYVAVDGGDSWGAVTTLAYALRTIPGEDPALIDNGIIDEGVAATRFAVYIMGELMDEATRKQFRDTVLEPRKYPTDELLELQYDVTHAPSIEDTIVIIDRFWALANGPNPATRVASLTILAAPYSFELWPHRAYARRKLVQEYPNLEITRTVLQWTVADARKKGEEIGKAMADVVEKELATPEEQSVLASDPASSLVLAALPQLLDANPAIQSNGVTLLCSGITDELDWRTRFACINQAVGFRDLGYAQAFESACETLASSGLGTPDVVRAQCLLLGYAREAGDTGKARRWGEELLGIDRVFDTIDRTLHEDVGNAIEFYGDFLETNGRGEEAASVYERLGARFPNSVLAAHCKDRAAAIRKR